MAERTAMSGDPSGSRSPPQADTPVVQVIDINVFDYLRACRNVGSPKSLLDYGFEVIKTVGISNIIPRPRYGEYSPQLFRLVKTKYSQIRKPEMVATKLLLHMDSIVNSVQDPVLDLGKVFHLSYEQKLNILRLHFKILVGVNPKRFRYRQSIPKTVRELTLEANLELNKVLGPDPSMLGPDYIPELKDVDVFDNLDIKRPSIEEIRSVNAYEAAQVRERLGYRPKKGGIGESVDIFTYKLLLHKVICYHYVKEVVVRRVVEPLLDWRKRYFSFKRPLEVGGEYGLLGPYEYMTRFHTFLERYGKLSKLMDSLVQSYSLYRSLRNFSGKRDKVSARAHEECMRRAGEFVNSQAAFADFLLKADSPRWSFLVRKYQAVSRLLLRYIVWAEYLPSVSELISDGSIVPLLNDSASDGNAECEYLVSKYATVDNEFQQYTFQTVSERSHEKNLSWAAAENDCLRELSQFLEEQTEKKKQAYIILVLSYTEALSRCIDRSCDHQLSPLTEFGVKIDKLTTFRV